LRVRIQFADECVSILFRSGCKLSDERFDQVTAGIPKRGGAAEIRCVSLYERWIEIVLTNQQAELVTQSRLAVAGAVCSTMTVRMRPGRDGHLRSGERTEFFDTAKSDSVGLSKSSVDGPRLGNTHFGATNEGRRVGGIGITVTDEPLRAAGLENYCAEDPAASQRVGLSLLQDGPDPETSRSKSYSEQTRVRHVPFPIDARNLALRDRK
jgi:hypothetical protein